jgi:hypothetical protein
MTAQVKILVNRLENVLSVPVQAVLQYNGKDHVTKKLGDRYDRVEVTLGVSNDKFVQVTKGLADGDVVVLNPISLMSEDEKREAFRSAKETKKDWGKEGEPGKEVAPGKGVDPAKAKTKKGGRGGAGGAMFKKFQNLSPDERDRLKSASPEEKAELLKKAGFTDQELEQMKNFGGGGGGGGRGGRGGPPGGGDQ